MIKKSRIAKNDPVRWAGPRYGWGFWDEVWLDFHGYYATRAEAEEKLKDYTIWLG